MPAWEYKTIVRAAHEMLKEEELNLIGSHGFELVQVLDVVETVTVVGRRETADKVHYFFRRVRPAQSAAPKAPAPAPETPQPSA